VRGFAWADLDGDGVPDAVFLTGDGSLRAFVNQRGGSFAEQRLPDGLPSMWAIVEGDTGADDSILDVWTLGADGMLHRLWRDAASETWRVDGMTHVDAGTASFAPGAVSLRTADLDNNGATDVIVTAGDSTHLVLREADG